MRDMPCAALFVLRGYYNSYFGYQSGACDFAGSNNTLIGSLSELNDAIDSLERTIAIGFNSRVSCSTFVFCENGLRNSLWS